MNRRKFFKWLGVGIAGAAVAPSVVAAAEPVGVTRPSPWDGQYGGCTCSGRSFWEGQCEWCARQPKSQEILGYVDYTSFSAMAVAAAIDDMVAQTAKELGEAAGRDIATLQASVLA